MTNSLDITILWSLSVLLQLWIALKIFRGDFGASLRFFAIYLSLSSVVSVFLAVIPLFTDKKDLYGYFFICWSYLATAFEFVLIRELSSEAFQRYPAIMTASRRTLNAFWAVLILVGGAWYLYLSSIPANKYPILRAAIRYQESVSLGFTLFILLFLAFVAWMPVPLTRPVLLHCFLVGAYFLFTTMARFILELGQYSAQRMLANYVGLGGSVLVYCLWIVKVKPSDDQTLNTPKGPVDPAQAAVMIARLEELNRTLARASTKGLS
jgi:hypothetical protein